MPSRRLFIPLFGLGVLAAAALFASGLWSRKPPEPIVILVGLDGFRSDYLSKFSPPTLGRLAEEGVTTASMIPCFPTLTFPNLYTLATGLRPEKHGIVGNSMYDPEFDARFSLGSPEVKEGRWWGGEPVWLTAERQGLRSACMFWPGSEAEIQGRRPTDWRPYDGKVTAEQRVATVLEWLSRPEEIRPRLITLYFHEADSAGHRHGVDSPETAAAVQVVDDAMAMLLEGIKSLGLDDRVNLVCVADHGMTDLDPARTVVLRDLVDLEAVQVDFNGAVAGLRPKAEEDTAAMVARLNQQSQGRFRAYEREKMPEAWHYRNHRRIPPVILVAEEGWSIIKRPLLSEGDRRSFLKATHGFPPELASMGATFVAWGPEFRQRAILPSFENVEVYGLICDTLGINPSPHDGTGWLSAQALRQPSR